ncbi:MAG: 1,2-phenylacetyl-CoA epoxidase subunit PaaD [Ginsengibacter sp.]
METLVINHTEERIWKILEEVYDPEIPVLSVIDLGIVRSVNTNNDQIEINITPTYSGCPAMDVISMNIRMALIQNGFNDVIIRQQLSPAWTTDWMTEIGKQKLTSYGIAPPVSKTFDKEYFENLVVPCPLCRSKNTRMISEFGSTSCKALFQCNDCLEPFDYFKCH